ncbi:MAG: hypothetical protein IMW92_13455, partial [Bacillales bacterium]|nr:hypothetical protein [Bacillales bacterium]
NIELEFNGKILIPGYNENIVFIPDDFIGLEYLTPLEVCRYFTLLYGECFDQDKFNNIIEIANLEKTIAFKEFIKNLSKGTKQKVSFLIYMMINRDIIIFDEGLENIDEKSLTNILNYLNKWVKTNKKLCLIATHSKIILNHIEEYIYLTKINDSDGTLILKSEDSKFNKNHPE